MARLLTKQECTLIKTLVTGTSKEQEVIKQLPFYIVQDMDDGGMESLLFFGKDENKQYPNFVLVEGVFLMKTVLL